MDEWKRFHNWIKVFLYHYCIFFRYILLKKSFRLSLSLEIIRFTPWFRSGFFFLLNLFHVPLCFTENRVKQVNERIYFVELLICTMICYSFSTHWQYYAYIFVLILCSSIPLVEVTIIFQYCGFSRVFMAIVSICLLTYFYILDLTI